MNVCRRPECQSTAGCAYRGPRGGFCYFAGDFGPRTEPIYPAASPAAPSADNEYDIPRSHEEWTALIEGRDSFIVNRGLWSEFVDALPKDSQGRHIPALAQSAARIEELEAEVEQWKQACRREGQDWKGVCSKLEAALYPLATQSRNYEGFPEDRIVEIPVLIRELRAARALITPAQTNPGSGGKE